MLIFIGKSNDNFSHLLQDSILLNKTNLQLNFNMNYKLKN